MRGLIREFVIHKLGNGESTSMWFDSWDPAGPLCNFVSNREIYTAGFDLHTTVRKGVEEGLQQWPMGWLDRHVELQNVTIPTLDPERVDTIHWRDKGGNLVPFSVRGVWENIRPTASDVPWYQVVWFSQCIPRHTFVLWLAIGRKLKTQDRISVWDHQHELVCPFCKTQPDSHAHLFFECLYPKQVWNALKAGGNMRLVSDFLDGIVQTIQIYAKGKTVWSVIRRLVFAATVYFIWQERNMRLFKGKMRPASNLIKLIKEVVRLKLLSLRFKRSPNVILAAELWKLPLEGSTYLDVR